MKAYIELSSRTCCWSFVSHIGHLVTIWFICLNNVWFVSWSLFVCVSFPDFIWNFFSGVPSKCGFFRNSGLWLNHLDPPSSPCISEMLIWFSNFIMKPPLTHLLNFLNYFHICIPHPLYCRVRSSERGPKIKIFSSILLFLDYRIRRSEICWKQKMNKDDKVRLIWYLKEGRTTKRRANEK